MTTEEPASDTPQTDTNPQLTSHEDSLINKDEGFSEGLWPPYCNPSYVMPDEIDVHVETVTGNYSFPVQIIKKTQRKLYFGGYRHKETSAVYHHASTQTPTEKKTNQREVSHLRTRETQTHDHKSVSVQPLREHGTQMQRIDLYLDNKRDVEITSKPYFTAEELFYLKREKCVEIQRVWRGYMSRCRAIRLKQNIVLEEERALEAKEHNEKTLQEQKMQEMRKRTHPTTNEDFARLYNELDAWRKAEVAKVKANTTPGEERRRALEAILAEETEALQNIQRLKNTAHRATVQEKTQKMLELMAQPNKWAMSDGDVATVQTPASTRAKELLDLYNALNAPLVGTNQRLEILLNVKWTVKESMSSNTGGGLSVTMNCNKEILDLVDREADLLNRGRPFKSMESLRKRISNLFLQFIENPAYNPRATEFINIPVPPTGQTT